MTRLPWTLAQHQRWTRVALRSGVAAFAPVMTEGERAFALWLFGKWVEERAQRPVGYAEMIGGLGA